MHQGCPFSELRFQNTVQPWVSLILQSTYSEQKSTQKNPLEYPPLPEKAKKQEIDVDEANCWGDREVELVKRPSLISMNHFKKTQLGFVHPG